MAGPRDLRQTRLVPGVIGGAVTAGAAALWSGQVIKPHREETSEQMTNKLYARSSNASDMK